jgi:nicotinate-nucleotide--dimethylbenzimidazole phosphoribosyltransferase
VTALRSFADLRALMTKLPAADEAARIAAQARDAVLTKPPGSLGRLEEIAAHLAAWQGRHPPRVDRPAILVFAGNHGVAARGVSAYPSTVTAQMVTNFAAGGAAINQLAKVAAATLKVVPLSLDRPTADLTEVPAMGEAETIAAIAAGMDAVPTDADLVAVGEMGIGNTTAAAALAAGLFGGGAADWVGPGTGVDAAGLARKRDAVDQALALHRTDDPWACLARLGGRELAAIAGAVLQARIDRRPVLLDGYVATAAAAVLARARPDALAHCLAAHRSAEPAHGRLLERLGLRPLFDLGLRLGEGSGAALGVCLARAAIACHTGMASFAEAGVSGRDLGA